MGKIILISGGSDGLGKEIARVLQPDNQVIILARGKDKLIETSQELGCDYVVADVTDFLSLESAVTQIYEKYKKVDVVINGAGLWIEGPLETNDPAQISRVMDANATGTILLTRAVLPDMQAKKSGLIINVISQSGLKGKKDRSVYHASKWAITGFTKSLEEEVAGDGIRVTGIYPGKMNTGFFQKVGINKPMTNALEVGPVAQAIKFVVEMDETIVIPELGIKVIGG